MSDYCLKDFWINNEICGETCAQFGMTTDPNCGKRPYLTLADN